VQPPEIVIVSSAFMSMPTDNSASFDYASGDSMDSSTAAGSSDYMNYEDPYANITWINPGRIKLLSDLTLYQASFDRPSEYYGWTDEVANYLGQEGTNTYSYDDYTISVEFDDGVYLDFPMESVAE
jgi:hypothetical protein